MSEADDRPRLVACTVERRGRFLVASPLFDDGQQLALGRRSGQAVQAGELVVVERSRGSARVVERLGSPDHVGQVLRALLLERGLAGEWPQDALREARAVSRAHEPEGRRDDLLGLEAITIDPPTARDFDDAISVERDGDGMRVWIHIADVASYVKPGGALDTEAGRRTCSVYVPGAVEPMLPLELSADACSLRPGEVRRVVTIELRVGADGKAGPPRVRRALIRSSARLSYDEAHAVLEGRRRHPSSELLGRADALARDLRARRNARGAFSMASRELSFEIEGGSVVGARWDEEPRAHALVEELMLLANEAVGGLLARARRPALYRVHDHPKLEAILGLVARLEALGLPVAPLPERPNGPEASRWVARQAALLEPIMRERPATREPFGTLLLRTLQQARYDPANSGHAALASPAYVHFTSPIRRYPDIVVHRAVCALASLGDEAPQARELPELGERCSQREREAADAERRADAICLAFLLQDTLRRDGWHQSYEGIVTGLIGAGLFVRFGDVFEGFLPARRLDARERFDVDEQGVALVGRSSGRRIRLGDELSVVVTAVDPPRGRATLDMLPEHEAPRARARPAKATTPRRPPKTPRTRRAPERRTRP